jgi:hypothetical protein
LAACCGRPDSIIATDAIADYQIPINGRLKFAINFTHRHAINTIGVALFRLAATLM